MKKKVLMVCLGNICRSPVADGLLKAKVKSEGLDMEVDSCGTGAYHVGESPDPRSQENALKNGLDISALKARQFCVEDFEIYDHIFCMDNSNLKNIRSLSSHADHIAKTSLMLDLTHPGQNKDVPDPYFGGASGFQDVFNLLDEACDAFIKQVHIS